LNYRLDLDHVLKHLDGIEGLYSVGRQARFDYLNMDQCISKGLEAAKIIANHERPMIAMK